MKKYKRMLSSTGIYVLGGGSMARVFQLMVLSMTGVKNMELMIAKINQTHLLFMIELVNSGKVRPIIDQRFPLSETAEALQYHEEGHARGKVVVMMP